MIFRIKDYRNNSRDYFVIDSGKFADKDCLYCVQSIESNSYEEFEENVNRQVYQIDAIQNPEYPYRKMWHSDFVVEYSDKQFIVVKSIRTDIGMTIEPLEE